MKTLTAILAATGILAFAAPAGYGATTITGNTVGGAYQAQVVQVKDSKKPAPKPKPKPKPDPIDALEDNEALLQFEIQ